MPPPLEWTIDQICEAYPAYTPLTAYRDLIYGPHGWLLEVLEVRSYGRTKLALDRARTEAERPHGPMVERVLDIAAELVRRQREGRADEDEAEPAHD